MIELAPSAPFVRKHRDQIFVIKVGGACLARPRHREAVVRQIGLIHAFGAKVVVVHGGGPQTDELTRQLGEEPCKIGGRRVTSEVGLRALRMATSGILNGDLVASLTSEGAPAVGVGGASAGLLVSKRRPPRVLDGEVIDFGEVGDLVSCDPSCASALLDRGMIPVICPPASDGSGGHLNVNADLAAAEIAVGLGARKLVLVTDASGILSDPEDADSLLSTLSLDELRALGTEGSFQGGMEVKATAIERALEGGVSRVHVVSGLDPEALLGELYTTEGTGTLITRTPLGTGGESAPALAVEGGVPCSS